MRRSTSAWVAVVVWAHAALAADVRGGARLWAGAGLDTNARRDFVIEGTPTAPDAFLYGLGQANGSVDFERARLAGAYDVAARKFVSLATEDTIVQALSLSATTSLGKYFVVGLTGRARDRRGAERDYTDLVGEGLVQFTPDAAVDVQVRGGPHRFLFWPRFAASHWGPDVTVNVRYRFNRKHSFSLLGNLNARTYNALAYPNPANEEPSPARPRADSVTTFGVSYAFRGPFQLTVGYSYFDLSSNSFGETFRRHRFTATGGVRLPWSVTALATGALQFSEFPDGVFLSPDLQVVEDEENSSSLTLKLVKPVAKWVDFDVRYAVYANVLQRNGYVYTRHVFSLGFAFSTD